MIQNLQKAKLTRLKKYNGKYVEKREDVEEELVQYFETIMKEDCPDRLEDIKKNTRHILR